MNTEQCLPPRFVERLQLILPPDAYRAALARIEGSAWCGFRVNTLKTTIVDAIDQLRAAAFDPAPWIAMPEAWAVPIAQRERLVYSPLVESGHIYIQNYASMLPARALQVQPGMEVLDLAAAPGGKTLHLAALMENQGRIAAVEVVKGRYYRLLDNVQRGGAQLVQAYCKDGGRVGRQVPERFDRVLLDAPCSSEARFNLERPNSWSFWSEKKIADMQRKQKQLLYSAVLALKPNGRLIYSTCSFAPEENEVVIRHILKKFPEQLELEPIDLPGVDTLPGLTQWRGRAMPEKLQHARRVIPNASTDAFFICALRKRVL
jgi:NOL1/NOP2/sun family putative RNA methylase